MTAGPSRTNRIPALDFTKGALVLIMVFYHWLNYFIGPNLDYRYLRFLTPSFIFVAGFLISHVYLARYKASDPRLAKRLLARGLKLLVVFIVLNVGRALILPTLSGSSIIADELNPANIRSIFVAGNVAVATSKVFAFYILIPISYLLVVAAALLFPYRFYKHAFHAACVLGLLCIMVEQFNNIHSQNLEFLTVGLLGAVAGFTPVAKINELIRRGWLLTFAYICYIAAITVWNVPFPLLCLGVCLSLAVIYLVGLHDAEPGRIRSHIILLGKHSLLGYVAQIAILQMLSAGSRHIHPRFVATVVSFVAAFALTMATVEVVERVKGRSMIVERLYRVAFA